MALRRVLLWVEIRKGGDAPGLPDADSLAHERISSAPASLRPPLRIVSDISSEGAASRRAVADACVKLAEWVSTQGSQDSEIELRQAAALACPADPVLTLVLGRLHRDRAEYSRAESWLQRTVGLAREAEDWETYSLAYVALGIMAIHRGAYPEARKHLGKAVRRARRHGLADPLGMALHELHVIATDLGEWAEANRYAREALAAYGSDHRNLLRLAHDAAFSLMEQGRFRQAHAIFSEISGGVPENARAYFVGSFARSSAGVGREDEWEAMRSELEGIPEGPGTAEAWVEIAQGGALLERFAEALEAVERGRELARSRGEAMIEMRAEGVQEAIRAEMVGKSARATPAAQNRRADDESEEGALVDALAREIAQRFRSAT